MFSKKGKQCGSAMDGSLPRTSAITTSVVMMTEATCEGRGGRDSGRSALGS